MHKFLCVRACQSILEGEWKEAALGEMVEIKNGATPNTQRPVFWNGTIPWCTPTDVTATPGKYLLETERNITSEGLASCAASLLPVGTLLLCSRATIGEIKIAGTTLCTNQGFKALICNSSVSNEFLYYLLLSLKPQLIRLAAGSTFLELGKRDIASIGVHFPLFDEQIAIGKALSDVDRFLESLDALIAKKRAIKWTTMQQLLTGKTRLPGFSGKWGMKQIGEFSDCTAGGTPSTLIKEYWGGSIRWMNSGELTSKRILDVEGRITVRGLRESSTRILPPQCVLIGLAGQGKTRGTVAINLVELCTNQSIAAIFPNESFVPEYLFYNLDVRYHELRGMSTGDGGRGGLNLQIIRSIAVPFPEIGEQHAIAGVLSDMDSEIVALEHRLNKARAIKRGMMQVLLTGRVRLVDSQMALGSAVEAATTGEV